MTFSKWNNPAKKRAAANARARRARREALSTYTVIVYSKADNKMIERATFKSYDAATEYTEIYKGNPNLGAYIQ